ncbi:hypothetical protein NKR19_g6471 [Coniochaeta hoffmannii]|uniref:Uncharacterized protein n=1 Tax=Coniochaeta hoffmannii TaxID=91930 RepID=A0AA38RS46_9PEZI|nr:hypothetical protein NKR19_g6471 [Coniochaeta hoffmannii]
MSTPFTSVGDTVEPENSRISGAMCIVGPAVEAENGIPSVGHQTAGIRVDAGNVENDVSNAQSNVLFAVIANDSASFANTTYA